MYQYAFLALLILILLCKDKIEKFSNDTCDIYEYKFKKLEEKILENNIQEKKKKDEPQPNIIINNYIPEEEKEDEDEEVVYSEYSKGIKENRILLYIIIAAAVVLFIIVLYNIIKWFIGEKEYIDISYDEAMEKVKNDMLMKKYRLKIK